MNSLLSKPYPFTEVHVIEILSFTVLHKYIHGKPFSAYYVVYFRFSGDVFDLTAGKLEHGRQFFCLFFRETRK